MIEVKVKKGAGSAEENEKKSNTKMKTSCFFKRLGKNILGGIRKLVKEHIWAECISV